MKKLIVFLIAIIASYGCEYDLPLKKTVHRYWTCDTGEMLTRASYVLNMTKDSNEVTLSIDSNISHLLYKTKGTYTKNGNKVTFDLHILLAPPNNYSQTENVQVIFRNGELLSAEQFSVITDVYIGNSINFKEETLVFGWRGYCYY